MKEEIEKSKESLLVVESEKQKLEKEVFIYLFNVNILKQNEEIKRKYQEIHTKNKTLEFDV